MLLLNILASHKDWLQVIWRGIMSDQSHFEFVAHTDAFDYILFFWFAHRRPPGNAGPSLQIHICVKRHTVMAACSDNGFIHLFLCVPSYWSISSSAVLWFLFSWKHRTIAAVVYSLHTYLFVTFRPKGEILISLLVSLQLLWWITQALKLPVAG